VNLAPPLTREQILDTRRALDKLARRIVPRPGTTVGEEVVAGRRTLVVWPDTGPVRGTVLHFFGGGYRAGSPEGSVGFAAQLAHQAGVRVVLPSYRLAPEDPFPAAVEDAVAVYDALSSHGRIVVSGQSAGGGLAAAALLTTESPQPAGLAVLCGWLDLTPAADSYHRCAATDPIFSREAAARSAACYLNGADPEHAAASPLRASDAQLAKLPPTFLQVGTDEVLIDDSRAFARRLADLGTRVVLRSWPRVTHSWQSAVPHSLAVAAIDELGVRSGSDGFGRWRRGVRRRRSIVHYNRGSPIGLVDFAADGSRHLAARRIL
jgi:epsilon-lactone hydrolase